LGKNVSASASQAGSRHADYFSGMTRRITVAGALWLVCAVLGGCTRVVVEKVNVPQTAPTLTTAATTTVLTRQLDTCWVQVVGEQEQQEYDLTPAQCAARGGENDGPAGESGMNGVIGTPIFAASPNATVKASTRSDFDPPQGDGTCVTEDANGKLHWQWLPEADGFSKCLDQPRPAIATWYGPAS
jgi:hypothetical protein